MIIPLVTGDPNQEVTLMKVPVTGSTGDRVSVRSILIVDGQVILDEATIGFAEKTAIPIAEEVLRIAQESGMSTDYIAFDGRITCLL